MVDERNYKCVTVSYNGTGALKKRKNLIRGCSVAQQVRAPLVPAQGL